MRKIAYAIQNIKTIISFQAQLTVKVHTIIKVSAIKGNEKDNISDPKMFLLTSSKTIAKRHRDQSLWGLQRKEMVKQDTGILIGLEKKFVCIERRLGWWVMM